MTTARLLALRLSMARAGLSAYIVRLPLRRRCTRYQCPWLAVDTNGPGSTAQVPTDDAHQSEYVAACYKRREFISQFSGSAGTAVITNDRAMLWTDGRYFLQAAQELDANWTLMRDRVPGAVPIQDWLADELPNGATVGFISYLLSNKMVGEMRAALTPKNISLRGLDADLIDEVRCRTACADEPTCAAALCSEALSPDCKPTSVPPTSTLAVSICSAYG